MQKDPLVTTVRERYGLNINEIIDPYAADRFNGLISNWFIIANACDHVVSRKDQDHSNIYRGFDRFSLDWLRATILSKSR